KSLAVTVFWPCWEWLSRPETRWLFASYAQQLSTRDSLKCRRLISGPGFADPRVPESERTLIERIGYLGLVSLLADMRGEVPWQLTGDQSTKQRFENSRTGYRIATSVDGVATGEGGDRVVCDDPHKADEAQSDVTRESVLSWWDQTMSTRLNDPRTGAKVIVMQRLHERDLTGHLAERGGYAHLCLPAEYEPSHPFAWPGDPRTEPGELLWPKRIDRGSLEEIKVSLGSYGAAGQLQQRPAPDEGGILKRSWWRWWSGDHERAPHFDQIVQSWDMAFTDSDGSDYVVGQVWGKFGADKYLLRQVRQKLEFTETVQAVIDLTEWVERTYPARKTHAKLVEDKANGPAVISQLRRRVPGLIAVDPQGDKVARARAVAPDVEAGNVYLPGAPNATATDYDPTITPAWVRALVDECAAFPNSAHDDQVDALSQALMRLAGRSGNYRQKGGRATRAGGMRDREL
ncbi:MAG TPA: phage terminase large subunit, partial [Thermoleophilaceae bacterium]|nr:phage terminase large subunit [Thermoleophilaceae bacterium]